MSRRHLWAGVAGVLAVGSVLVGGPAPGATTPGWATWGDITGSSNDYATTMQLPGRGFPQATVASDSRSNVQLPSGASTFLRASTPPGAKYGSSEGEAYLNLRPKADNSSSPSTTSYTFDSPTPAAGWTFVLGDVDADRVRITARGADGAAVSPAAIDRWFKGVFNYAGGANTDVPIWNAGTGTLDGNLAAADTNGAAGWFEPDVPLSSLTFEFTRRSGFPVYQAWFASLARDITGTVDVNANPGGTCSAEGTTLRLLGADGTVLDTTTAAANGSYSFTGYTAAPGYVVEAVADESCLVDSARRVAVDLSDDDGVADFDVREIVPQPISGIVTAGTQPVPGVTVTLTPPGGGMPRTTTTDSAGSYLFDDNAIGEGYAVSIAVPTGYRADGPTTRTGIEVDDQPIVDQDFALEELPSITGQVTGGGNPLGGVAVTLTPDGGGADRTTTTKGDGTYEFERVADDTYAIAVESPAGFDPPDPREDVAVAGADVPDQDFALSRPGTLGGRVTEEAGAPVDGAAVTVTGPGGTRTIATDTDGAYYLDALAPGTYEITLSVPDGFASEGVRTRTVTISEAGENRGGQDFVIERVFSASGSVTAGGDPVEGAAITITDPAGDDVSTVRTGTDGTFTASGLPAGDGYRATVTAPSGFEVRGDATIDFDVDVSAVDGIDFALVRLAADEPGGPGDDEGDEGDDGGSDGGGDGGGDDDAGADGPLPGTGADADAALVAGVALVAGGSALLGISRPRRRSEGSG